MPVFDLTEEATQHFVANGLLVHNCSEYMFLDDSACNLASINLMKLAGTGPAGGFDIEGYRHAINVFTVAMEIIVDFASYPTQPIAKNSHDYRPLGLGYANLGTLLMVDGIPYDSNEGRGRAAALSAILCGHAYATSAELAARKGPFPGYPKNRESMAEVMAMHRDAAYDITSTDCPSPAPRGGPRRLGPRRGPGRALRLPERAGDGDRAHGDDRTLDGLRHDRGRARLRARQVQEARGRRLLQDREPLGEPRARNSRVLDGGDRGHHSVRERDAHVRWGAAH